jgi:hypothetical protein
MADESRELSASFDLHTSSASQSTAPPWSADAIIMLRDCWARWLLMPLVEHVRVRRGRAGTFEVLDFVLILLVYATSGARTLKDFYQQAKPVLGTLAAAWQRRTCPSPSALSRFLKDVSSESVESMRPLF